MSTIRFLTILTLALVGCDKAPPGDAVPPPAATAGAAEEVLTLPNEAKPYHGLVTAGQPTNEQFLKLKAAGYTAVINLRAADEPGYWDEKETATRNGILYTHIPVTGPDDLTRENVRLMADTMEQPMAKNGKVLLHCGSGNRAGAFVALKAGWLDGRSVDDAIELGQDAGLGSLEEAVREKLTSK